MEYTELSDYPLPSGRVTEWTMRAPSDAWVADNRRLSLTHLAHAGRAVTAGDDWHSEWIGTAFYIEHRLDAVVMARTLERWYARHEVFRSTVILDDCGEFTRRTVPSEATTADCRLVGRHLSSTAVYEHISEHFDTTVSPLRWPHCIAVTVEPHDDEARFLFVFAADHTVMDAYTQVFAIDEVIALYGSELTGAPDGLPQVGSHIDFCDAERAHTDTVGTDDVTVAAWSRFFGAHTETTGAQPDRMPAFPVSTHEHTVVGDVGADASASSANQASLSSWILDAEGTEQFHRVCKAAGANMQAGVYTALTIAAHRRCGDSRLRLINPIHTRNAPQWAGAAGWFVDIVPVHLDPGDAHTFREAITHVARSAADYRTDPATPYSAVPDVLDDPATALPPQFVVSYIDMRAAAGAQHWDRRAARVLRSATAQADEVYLWINRVPNGTNISARFPSGAAGTPMSDFITAFAGVMHEVVAAGDAAYTSPLPVPSTEVLQ